MTIKYFLQTDKRQWQPIRLAGMCFILIGAICLFSISSVDAQVTGPADNAVLQKRIAIFWNDVPLRDAFNNLSSTQGVPIFLDRRVDPGLRITFKTDSLAVGEILYQVAEIAGCGVAWLGNVAYVGPAGEIATLDVLRDKLIQDCQKLPGSKKRLFLEASTFRMPRLGNPVEVTDALLEKMAVQKTGLSVAHDRWVGMEIRSVRAIDKLLLLSFGFGLWPVIDAKGNIDFVNQPQVGDEEMKIRLSQTERDTAFEKLQADFPNTAIRKSGKYLVIRGGPDELHEVRHALYRQKWRQTDTTPSSTEGTKVVSGRIRGSIGQALNTAAKGLSLELQFAPSLRSELLQQIDIKVSGVTYEELAERVLENTDLSHSIQSGKLIVTKK